MFPTVLDASRFRSGSATERQEFAQNLVQALKNDGFVKLQNHGIPDTMMKELFSWV